MKRVNVYDVIREMREQIVETMQERGITELAMYLSPEEWAKENDCKYEPDEDGYDEQYDDYKRDESPYVIFFDKYNHGIDYRVDKVTLKTEGLGAPVLEFECYNDEWGYNDTFGEDDLVFMTLYNVYDTLLDRLGIEDEPVEPKKREREWQFDEQAFIEKYCPMAGGNDYLGWIDDIYKLLNGETEEGDAASTGEYANMSEDELRKELKRLTCIVLKQAVDEYVERFY